MSPHADLRKMVKIFKNKGEDEIQKWLDKEKPLAIDFVAQSQIYSDHGGGITQITIFYRRP